MDAQKTGISHFLPFPLPNWLRKSDSPQDLTHMSILTTKTHSTTIIRPAQTKIIHPPKLWFSSHCNIYKKIRQILKPRIQIHVRQNAIRKFRTCWNIDGLLSYLRGVFRSYIVLISSKCEIAWRTHGITTE